MGIELSTMFAKLGMDVTVVEMLNDVLPTYKDGILVIVRERVSDLDLDFNFCEGDQLGRDRRRYLRPDRDQERSGDNL